MTTAQASKADNTKKYNPQDFIDALKRKTGPNIRQCPFCHGNRFTSTEQLASILIGDNIEHLSLGPSIPTGMIICQNCGHIDFFALGALGLLNKEESPDA